MLPPLPGKTSRSPKVAAASALHHQQRRLSLPPLLRPRRLGCDCSFGQHHHRYPEKWSFLHDPRRPERRPLPRPGRVPSPRCPPAPQHATETERLSVKRKRVGRKRTVVRLRRRRWGDEDRAGYDFSKRVCGELQNHRTVWHHPGGPSVTARFAFSLLRLKHTCMLLYASVKKVLQDRTEVVTLGSQQGGGANFLKFNEPNLRPTVYHGGDKRTSEPPFRKAIIVQRAKRRGEIWKYFDRKQPVRVVAQSLDC